MLANGNIFVCFPILVFPSMWTFETSSTPYFNSTFYLGKLYLRGLGVAKDEKKGLRFIKEAANGNVNDAIIEMAKIHEQGRYVKKDLKVALDYYSKLKNNESLDIKDDINRIKQALNYW